MFTFATSNKQALCRATLSNGTRTRARLLRSNAQHAKVRHLLGSSTRQGKTIIGQPGDKYEQEAERIADQIMRMPQRVVREETNQHMVSKDAYVQPQKTDGDSKQIDMSETKLNHGGHRLSESTRTYFESRMRHDFSAVRIHTGSAVSDAAQSINARAFTVGEHIAFNQGQYSPESSRGKRLLAHELTHVIQQDGRAGFLQRDLFIAGPEDSSDPMATLDPDERNDMVRRLVNELGDGFDVVGISGPGGATGQIVRIRTDCDQADDVAQSGNRAGNCCLCIMTRAGATDWTIRVVQESTPSTDARTRTHVIRIPPENAPVEYGYWTASSKRNIFLPSVVFGHELCGHAALVELNAHPGGFRLRGTRHDPTVKIEREIAREQGVPEDQLRGLAASGPHRGESFSHFVVSSFRFDKSNPDHILLDDLAEFSELEMAARFAFKRDPTSPDDPINNNWVDITGHSDPVGSESAKQKVSDRRARSVQRYMMTRLDVPYWINKRGVSGRRFTDVRGVSDSQPLPGEPHKKWRRVDIFITGRPAGAGRPIPATPSGPATLTPSTPEDPAAASQTYAAGDTCDRLLIDLAWSNRLQPLQTNQAILGVGIPM